MKKMKGFTLIELLAIIVILAMIAVITVPIILNVIDNASKGAAINSAYGFRDSVSKGYLTGILSNDFEQPPTGTYIMMSNGNMTDSNSNVLITNVSGNYPEEDSWIELDRGQVVAFSLKFGEYVVTKYSDTDAVAVKGGTIAENTVAREARLEAERQASAIELARTIVDAQTGTTGITDITEGWVAFINGSLKAYSVSVTVENYTYIVTDNDVNSTNTNVEASRVLTTVAEKTTAEQAIIDYYSDQVATKSSNYISALLENSTVSAYTENKSKKVSEISVEITSVIAPTGIDTNSWVYFKKETSVTAPDYSLKFTEGDYTFVVNSVDGTVSSPVLDGTLLPQKKDISIIIKRDGNALTSEQTIAVADTVTLQHGSYNDGFRVIEIDSTNNTATLLADNNINTSTGFQGANGQAYAVAFAGSQYWASKAADIYDSTKNDASGTNYSVAYHVNSYVTNLRNVGFTEVQTTGARILKKSEVEPGGIAASYKTSGEHYWLGSTTGGNNVWYVYNNGLVNYGAYNSSYGVRPVIVISTSDL